MMDAEGGGSADDPTASAPASPPNEVIRVVSATAVSGNAVQPYATLLPAQPDMTVPTPDFPQDNLPEDLLSAFGSALALSSAPSLASAAPPGTVSLPVPQVAAQIASALSQTADGATELALSPEELGHVRLRLEPDATNPDRMVVTITFERPETLDLFRRHAGELADALRSAGYAGADIGFGQDGGGSARSDRNPGQASGQDIPDPGPPPSSAPRLAVGASLDLRL